MDLLKVVRALRQGLQVSSRYQVRAVEALLLRPPVLVRLAGQAVVVVQLAMLAGQERLGKGTTVEMLAQVAFLMILTVVVAVLGLQVALALLVESAATVVQV